MLSFEIWICEIALPRRFCSIPNLEISAVQILMLLTCLCDRRNKRFLGPCYKRAHILKISKPLCAETMLLR